MVFLRTGQKKYSLWQPEVSLCHDYFKKYRKLFGLILNEAG
jgi:hypothetical protein